MHAELIAVGACDVIESSVHQTRYTFHRANCESCSNCESCCKTLKTLEGGGGGQGGWFNKLDQ